MPQFHYASSENSHNAIGKSSWSRKVGAEENVAAFVDRVSRQFMPFAMVLVCDEKFEADEMETRIEAMNDVVDACVEEGANVAITAAVDLCSPSAPEVIDQFRSAEGVRGARLLLNGNGNGSRNYGAQPGRASSTAIADLMGNRLWMENFALLEKADLLVDVDVHPEQISQLFYLLRDFPKLKVVLGQTGCPRDPDSGGDYLWRNSMAMISGLDNVHIKIGGLHFFDPDWNCTSVWPLVHHLLLCFGEDRVMFGSNCSLLSSTDEYAAIVENLNAIMPFEDVSRKVFRLNANRLFGLGESSALHGIEAPILQQGQGDTQ